jgi:hypothetical protein
MTRRGMSLKDAYYLLLSKRSIINPNMGFMEYLSDLETKKTLTPKEYAVICLKKSFPSVSEKEIVECYGEAESMSEEEYATILASSKCEAYGYTAINKLLEEFPGTFQETEGRTKYDPFD